MKKRFTQEQIDETHAMARKHYAHHLIATRLGLRHAADVRRILDHHKPSPIACSECGKTDTPRRRVKLRDHMFCASCHDWLFDSKNYGEARRKYPGIFA